jgi:polygalacturonase
VRFFPLFAQQTKGREIALAISKGPSRFSKITDLSHMRFFLFVCVLITSHCLVSSQDFNILEYGAKPDGITLNTTHIQSAVDDAHAIGGGRVVIPAGCFLSGSILLKSGVELHLKENAILLAVVDPSQYQNTGLWKALVMAQGQERISITGKGTLDGHGQELALYVDSLFYAGQLDSQYYEFPEMRPRYYMRPMVIVMMNCRHIEVRGVTIKNSSSWVQTYDQCDHILIDSVTVESDVYWNNDGIDISDCKNVRITNCFINSSDDGICLKSHSRKHYCDSIYIANCTIRSSASAIKFGTRSYGGFKNVTIEHIKVYDTFRSAIAIETIDGGTLENVLVEDVQAVNTGNAFFIRLGQIRTSDSTVQLKNIVLRNISVTVPFERPDYAYHIRGPALPFFHNIFPSSITGIPGFPVENVTLENIEIIYPGRGHKGFAYMPLHRLDQIPEKEAAYPEFSMFGELPAWGLYVRHVDGLTLKNISLRIEEQDYRHAVIFDDVKNLDIQSVNISGDNKSKHIVLHNTENVSIDNSQAVMKIK